MTTQHFPTPWKIDNSSADFTLISADYTPRAKALAPDTAAFIVRAVNSHTDLLKAVEWAIAALEKSTPHKDAFSKGFYHRALADCRAALAQAKAEP